MSRKEADKPGADKNNSTNKWADEVLAIVENSNQGGIEIRFNAEPSPQLQSKLRAMSFRHSRTHSMWYGDNNPTTRKFAEQVKSSLPLSGEGPELLLAPSSEAIKASLESKKFSFVYFTLTNGQVKNYIVFETSKPKAELIANNFAKKEFGGLLLSIAVVPRAHIREARILFDEGKIIFSDQNSTPTLRENVIKESKQNEPAQKKELPEKNHSEEKFDSLALVKSFHTWFKKDEGFEHMEIAREDDFNKWIKNENIHLSTENRDRLWKHHLMMVKAVEKLHNEIHGAPQIEPYSSIYKKLNKIIPDLVEHLKQGKTYGKSRVDSYMDLNIDFLGKDKDGNYLIALAHYYEQNGDMMKDPDMEIRVLPDTQTAEALTFEQSNPNVYQRVYLDKGGRELVNLKLKKQLNRFLNQWLSNLIEQKHKIDLSIDQDEETEIVSPAEPLHRQDDLSWVFAKAFRELTIFIPGLINSLKRGITEGELSIDEGGKQRVISLKLAAKKSGGRMIDIVLLDYLDTKRELQSEITIDTKLERAYVSAELTGHNYATKYDRIDDEEDILEPNGEVEEEMTKGLCDWLGDVLNSNYHIDLNQNTKNKDLTKKNKTNWREWEHGEQARFNPVAMSQLIVQDNYLHSKWSLKKDKEALTGKRFSKDHYDHLKAFWGVYVIQDPAIEKEYIEIYNALPDKSYYVDESFVEDETVQVNKLRQNILDENENNTPSEFLTKKDDQIIRDISPEVKGAIKDVISRSNPLPNIIVPLGVREPFLSNNFYRNTLDLKTFSDLKLFKDKSLTGASSSQLYELIQLSHPSDYSINVSRSALLEIFEEKGEQIFSELGLPTDRNYPYVNLHTGYHSVDPLYEVLGNEQNDWWAAAENYRAIGDLKTAVKIIEDEIEKINAQKKTLVNVKTDKVKGKDKELARQLNFDLTYFEKSKEVVLEYLKTNPSQKVNTSPKGIIASVRAAYWNIVDEEYPVNKKFISGSAFNQSRLREALLDLLGKLPIPAQLEITSALKTKFEERTTLEELSKGFVTIGKTGDKKTIALIRNYVDDIIIDSDLNIFDKPAKPGALQYLFDVLVNHEDILVDAPQDEPLPVIEKKVKKLNAHELNKSIEELIDKKDADKTGYTTEDKIQIAQYTGSGGLIKQGASGRGVLYEYYTPDEVVKKMWDLAYHYGYEGGPVLEPAVGTGNFLKYAPHSSEITGFETNHYSARIAQILFPQAKINEKAFETLFFAGNIHLKNDFNVTKFSLVIGNPPYGEFTGRYAGMGEKKWTGALEYDQYFILRGIDLLVKGGLLILLVPSSFLSYNVKSAKVKEKIALKSDLIDAYRLPNKTFDTTDIGTDIVILRKK